MPAFSQAMTAVTSLPLFFQKHTCCTFLLPLLLLLLPWGNVRIKLVFIPLHNPCRICHSLREHNRWRNDADDPGDSNWKEFQRVPNVRCFPRRAPLTPPQKRRKKSQQDPWLEAGISNWCGVFTCHRRMSQEHSWWFWLLQDIVGEMRFHSFCLVAQFETRSIRRLHQSDARYAYIQHLTVLHLWSLTLWRMKIKMIKMWLKSCQHARHSLFSFLSVTTLNKDIIDRDTLLLTVSPTPIWHLLKKKKKKRNDL